MLRYRRYRVFLAITALTIFLLYRFSHSSSQWDTGSLTDNIIPNQWAHHAQQSTKDSESPPRLPIAASNDNAKSPGTKDNPYVPDPPALAAESGKKVAPGSNVVVPKPAQNAPQTTSNSHSDPKPQHKPASEPLKRPKDIFFEDLEIGPIDPKELVLAEGGEARKNQDHIPTNIPVERWHPQPDHFPVPTESLKLLPTGPGKPIPKIQAKLKKEKDADKAERTQRLSTIKEAFQHAWRGYKEHAWRKDELKPVSGSSRNTFNGWGATLVDSLDTMWMMGMTEEFEEALEHVKDIDFHTSQRFDIPLFETTIRYLGGLLGAYDVSEAKYPILLEKAVMLGDILMGAFDTPNRMPITFFAWREAFTSQKHRAPSRVVLAEIGSLQMEFTRLAQLTGNSTYYDAITRIMDALDEWQDHTAIPGLWPADIDTSGCNTTAVIPYRLTNQNKETAYVYSPDEDRSYAVTLGSPVAHQRSDGSEYEILEKPDPIEFKVKPETKNLRKRQVGHIPTDTPEVPIGVPETSFVFREHHSEFPSPSTQSENPEELPECEAKGLDYSVGGWGRYTLGSTADSTYEYLSKMYLLLNGQVDRYRTMFEKSIDAANENLIFRIMHPDEKRELYGSGELGKSDRYNSENWKAESTHLTCFVGGMFAMGSKIFDRPKDLDIAAKLTDGCVWAYESTASGIMPEAMILSQCTSRKSCPWNETQWWFDIDPDAESRAEVYKEQMQVYSSQLVELASMTKSAASGPQTPAAAAAGSGSTTTLTGARAEVTGPQEGARAPPKGFDPHARPPNPKVMTNNKSKDPKDIRAPRPDKPKEKRAPPNYVEDRNEDPPTPTIDESEAAFIAPSIVIDAPPPVWSPNKPMTREEWVKARIDEDRLSPGMKSIVDNRYLLRYAMPSPKHVNT
jgi:mannosyl-oligosaccharide alpha-1,2-mannosidase